MNRFLAILTVIGGVVIAIFGVIIFFKPFQDIMGVARNNSSVAHYPKLGSAMDFGVLFILGGAFVVIFYLAWKRARK